MEKLPQWLKELLNPDVIKIMQIKFVAMAMGILICVFIVMLTAINMIMKTVSQTQSMRLLEKIAQSERYDTLNDEPPDDMPPPEPKAEEEVQEENLLPLGYMPDNRGGDGRRNREDRPPEFDGNRWDDEHRPPEFTDIPPWEQEESEYQDMPDIPVSPEENPPEEAPPEEVFIPEEPVEIEPVPPPEEVIHKTLPEEVITEILTESPEEITESETESPTEESESEATESEVPAEPRETPPPKPDDDHREFRMEMKPDKWKVNISLEHFALMANEQGQFLGIRNTENYTDKQAEEILEAILSTGKQQGMYGWLQYYKASKDYGTLLVITNKSSDQGILNNLFRTTVIVSIIVLLILFIFLIFFSRWITQPVRDSMNRQKQFVSDASHELKTPIAVLTANVDILQDEIGENKWLSYIQEQTCRMNQLVGDLLRLARMDNARQEYVFEPFNLSTAIEATALPFESQAFEMGKNLEIDIQPDVMYTGSQQHIRQLAAIFIDNAMKYSNPNGTIKITLLKRGDNPVLEFYNTGCEISQQETDKIFERFYRGDKARNNKGKNGYGLGLAIAKSIMEIHKIKIQVTCEQGAWIRFLMIM